MSPSNRNAVFMSDGIYVVKTKMDLVSKLYFLMTATPQQTHWNKSLLNSSLSSKDPVSISSANFLNLSQSRGSRIPTKCKVYCSALSFSLLT